MDKEQKKNMIEKLLKFIDRVSSDKDASPAEIAALPEIAKIILDESHIFNG